MIVVLGVEMARVISRLQGEGPMRMQADETPFPKALFQWSQVGRWVKKKHYYLSGFWVKNEKRCEGMVSNVDEESGMWHAFGQEGTPAWSLMKLKVFPFHLKKPKCHGGDSHALNIAMFSKARDGANLLI